MKLAFSALSVSAYLVALPALAATPNVSPPASASDLPIQTGVIRIGDRFCPAAPDSAIPDKMKTILSLVSTTCVMEASGLITHDEAQSVYQQALGNIQMAMAEIPTSDTAPALASK